MQFQTDQFKIKKCYKIETDVKYRNQGEINKIKLRLIKVPDTTIIKLLPK